jgi:protein TonB
VLGVPGKKGLAIVALALGLVGLFTAGGLGVGSLLGVALAGVSLASVSRGGRDVAWAALAANIFALLTVLPVSAAVMAYRTSPLIFDGDDDALPVPAQNHALEFVEPPPPLPPPPPAARPTPEPRPVQAKPQPTKPTSDLPSARQAGLDERRPAEAEPPTAPVRIGGTIQEPRKLRNVNPVYPPEAVQARVQGVVILECTISPTGKVVEVKTLRGVPLLNEPAIEAVRQWEYTPTELNGVPVPVIMTVTVNFKLR